MALPRTPDALDAIEHAVIAHYGDLTLAARALSISPIDLNQWSQADPEVASRLHQARLLGWSALESEAIRRATGYSKAVWYQGVEVGQETVYSDGLLLQLLKARVPAHKTEASSTGPMVQVNVMPRASTYEEWQAQRQLTLDAGATSEASSAEVVEDAQYTEIEPSSNGLPDWL